MKRDVFLEAMEFRFACKKFNPQKKICSEDFEAILESGRLSPSSFGLEPTRFVVITTQEVKEKLKPLCWNQSQITDCSHVVVYLSKINDLFPNTHYVASQILRRVDGDKFQAYKERYSSFLEKNQRLDSQSIFAWSALQAYIAATSMMCSAAIKQIDTCAIEGFDKKDVEVLLNLDTFELQVALIMCFGYRAQEQSKRHRLDLSSLVSYL